MDSIIGMMKMREIKFRAVYNGNISHPFKLGDYPMFKDGTTVSYWAEQCGIEQFTGLLDKNQKEIFEGDIVAIFYTNNEREGEIYSSEPVKWGVFDIGCNGREYSFEVVGPYVSDEYLYHKMIGSEVVIIGNIHQNPELLT